MIAPGTLCLIVSDHGLAGRTCTVVRVLSCATLLHRDGSTEFGVLAYHIDVPGEDDRRIGAFPRHLLPLAPPAPIESTEREAETC